MQKIDKYGKRVNKQDNTMKAFYKIKSDSEEDNPKQVPSPDSED